MVPSATQNELDEADAECLIDNGCGIVVEAANMPLTTGAGAALAEAGVVIAPGKAANAGGVAVSGFEMFQNRLGRSWAVERLDQELRDVMQTIFDRTKQEGLSDGRIDYRRGADRAGFKRVAEALKSFGHM